MLGDEHFQTLLHQIRLASDAMRNGIQNPSETQLNDFICPLKFVYI